MMSLLSLKSSKKRGLFLALLNLASLLFLLSLWMAYVVFIVDRVPSERALIINLILVPMMLGALGFFLIQGPVYVAVIIMMALPLVHVFYFGGDPAKPGLERFIGILELLFLCAGYTIAYIVTYLSRRFFLNKESKGSD